MDIEIINLTVKAKEKLVLDKFNLKINSGEVHVIQHLLKLLWLVLNMK